MYMEINNQGFVSIEQVTSRYFKGTAPEKEQSGNISFGDLLKEKVNEAGQTCQQKAYGQEYQSL